MSEPDISYNDKSETKIRFSNHSIPYFALTSSYGVLYEYCGEFTDI